MKKILFSQTLIILFFGFIFLFNELLGNIIDVKISAIGFLLILVLLSVLILVPSLRKYNIFQILVVATVIFFVVRMISNIFLMNPTNQIFLEYVFLLLGIAICVQYNQSIDDVKMTLDIIAMPKTKHQIQDLFETSDLIEQEFRRARRFNYPISMIIIRQDNYKPNQQKDSIFEDPQKKYNKKFSYLQNVHKLIKNLDDTLREFDQIIKIDDQKMILILCPNTKEDKAQLLVERIDDQVLTSMNIAPEIKVYNFPKDGPTFRSILSLAESKMS